MNYFIDPSWFYWIKVISGVQDACIVLSILLAIVGTSLLIVGLVELNWDEEVSGNRFIRVALIIGIVFIFTLLGSIFIPNKETLIEMQIARYATKENVDVTIESLKSVVDYIVESIGSLK